jgi:MFS family permease
LLFGVFLFSFAFAGLQSNFAVFTDVRFGFTPMDNALVFAFIGVIMVFMQGFLIRKLVPLFGEARLAIVGLVLMMLSFGLIPMVSVAWMLYPVLAVLAVGSGIATPAITGLLSQRASAQEQGSVLGGNQAVMSLTMVLGPLYAGFAFDAVGIAAPYLSGLVFISAAVVVLGSALWSSLHTHNVACQSPLVSDRA